MDVDFSKKNSGCLCNENVACLFAHYIRCLDNAGSMILKVIFKANSIDCLDGNISKTHSSSV